MTEKTLGRIAYETFCRGRTYPEDEGRLGSELEGRWEAAATAVWNEAVEACAKAINNLDPQTGDDIGSLRAGLNDSIAALRQLLAQTEWRRSDQELPRDGRVVIVYGGIAYRRDGRWYTITGKEWPGEVIQWPVDVWLPLPEPLANGEDR